MSRRKEALLVGINAYPTAPLRGCVNDAQDWGNYLRARGFGESPVLLDSQATRSSIMQHLDRLVSGLNPGDVGVFVFAGHGTWLPDKDGDELDGRDEALCPFDMRQDNLIIDDDLANVWIKLKPGAKFVLITDSCHSGTVFRFSGFQSDGEVPLPRYIPPGNFVEAPDMLDDIEKARRFAPVSLGAQPVAGFVHLSACQDHEYAGDARFRGRPNGAFSRTTLDVLNSWGGTGRVGTYSELMAEVRGKLPSFEFPQTPGINAATADKTSAVFE